MENHGALASPLLPIIFMMLPLIFICRRLAKDKGKSTTKYTILGCIPFVNYYALLYLVGATNESLEGKIDRLLSILDKDKTPHSKK
jgi:hypothetical protein